MGRSNCVVVLLVLYFLLDPALCAYTGFTPDYSWVNGGGSQMASTSGDDVSIAFTQPWPVWMGGAYYASGSQYSITTNGYASFPSATFNVLQSDQVGTVTAYSYANSCPHSAYAGMNCVAIIWAGLRTYSSSIALRTFEVLIVAPDLVVYQYQASPNTNDRNLVNCNLNSDGQVDVPMSHNALAYGFSPMTVTAMSATQVENNYKSDVVVTLTGRSFTTAGLNYATTVSFGTSNYNGVVSVSNYTNVVVTIPNGSGGGFPMTIRTPNWGTLTYQFTYTPTISSIVQAESRALTILGTKFGENGTFVQSVKIGSFDCTPVIPLCTEGRIVCGYDAYTVKPGVYTVTVRISPSAGGTTVASVSKSVTLNSTLVTCPSGYIGMGCATPQFGNCSVITPALKTTSPHPQINTTSAEFAYNALKFQLVSPFINGRTFKNIVPTASNVTNVCSLLADTAFWSATTRECNDVISVTIPWVNHTKCGFRGVESPDGSQIIFKSEFKLDYADYVGSFANKTYTRYYTNYFTVYIYFPARLSVSLSNFDVVSEANVEFALTKESYNTTTTLLALELTSYMIYPYALRNVTVSVPNSISVVGDIVYVNNDKCVYTPGTDCTQTHTTYLRIIGQNTCVFDGEYTLYADLLNCRENSTTNGSYACPSSPMTVTYNVVSGNACPSVSLHPTASGQLYAYKEKNMTTLLNNFRLGAPAYFGASINSGLGNVVELTFVDVFISRPGNDSKYLIKNSTITPEGNFTGITTSYNAFMFYLSGNVLDVKIRASSTYSVTANCLVTFQGSKDKRSVQITSTGSEISSMTATTFVQVSNFKMDENGECECPVCPTAHYTHNQHNATVHYVVPSGLYDLSAVGGLSGLIAVVAVCASLTTLVMKHFFDRVANQLNSNQQYIAVAQI